MPDPSSPVPAQPNRRSAGTPALEGEVLPPTMRVVNAPPPRDEAAPADAPGPSFPMRFSTAALALALLVSVGGAGVFGAYAWQNRAVSIAAQPSPTTLALAKLGRDLADVKASVDQGRQDETVRALKKSVDQLKAEFDGLRAANAGAIAQLNSKLDRPAVAAAPPAALAEVASRLDKLDHDPRLADITARLDRIERQVSAPTPTGSIAPSPRAPAAQTVVSQTSASAKPTVKPAVLADWIVRDVYSGIALVEGRSGSVREVVPGEVLPGAGEVRSIERHGRGWVVVTSRGVIDPETW